MLKYVLIGLLFAVGWNVGDYITVKIIKKWMRFIERLSSRDDCPEVIKKICGTTTTTRKIETKVPMGFHAN